jgi:hypothetical protein
LILTLVIIFVPFCVIWINDYAVGDRKNNAVFLANAANVTNNITIGANIVVNATNDTLSIPVTNETNATVTLEPSAAPSYAASDAPSAVPLDLEALPQPIPSPSSAAWTRLARSFFRINVPAGPNTRLPSNAVQALRIRANGTQNYQCQQVPLQSVQSEDNNSSSSDSNQFRMAWVLRYPLANLWLYSTINGTVNTNRQPDGIHYSVGAPHHSVGFANLVWDLGSNCISGDPLDPESNPPSCSTYRGRWRGKNPTSDPQVGTLSYLRLDKDESKMSPTITIERPQQSQQSEPKEEYYNAMWQFSFIQRLRTFGGLVSTANVPCATTNDINNTVSSVFESDFVLGWREVTFPSGVTGTIKLPDDCFQAHPFYAEGHVDYMNENGTWIPIGGTNGRHPIGLAMLRAYSTVDYADNTNSTVSMETENGNQRQSPLMKVISEEGGGLVGNYSIRPASNSTIQTFSDTKYTVANGTTYPKSLELTFEVGGDCSGFENHCDNASGLWRGSFIALESEINDNNLPLGLAEKYTNARTSLSSITQNFLSPYSVVQQLLTEGGTAPHPLPRDVSNGNITSNASMVMDTINTSMNNMSINEGKVYSSAFNCSFVFAFCVRDVGRNNASSGPSNNTLLCPVMWAWVLLGIVLAMMSIL